MMIRDIEGKISYLEELMQRISNEIIANVSYERARPTDLWAKSETDINAVKGAAKEIRDAMLILRPERAPSIKRRFKALMQPIENFTETLRRSSEQDLSVSKQALEHLRAAIAEGQGFIDLAREILRNPSESILEILKLKEVYGAKEYLLRISVPEAVYVRLEHLTKSMETLKLRILGLEQAIQELLRQMDRVQEEIQKFHRAGED